jgi:hypothetical protein
MPLTNIQAVFFGHAKKDIRDTLWMISGIEIRSVEDSEKGIEELRKDIKRAAFSLRGVTRQLKRIVRPRFKLAKRVIYAAHANPTHRVLVYAFAGRLLMESTYETIDGELEMLPCYEPQSYIVTPLARVDVRVPLTWLSGRYKDLAIYREAVERTAERIAWQWYRRWLGWGGHSFQEMAPWANGLTASIVGRLTPAMRRKEVYWKDARNIKTGRNSGSQEPFKPPSYVLPERSDISVVELYARRR